MPRLRRHRFNGLVLPVICLTAVIAAGAQSPQPRFKASADVVLVDVSVLDGDGRPITGLTASDFELTVNGTPRAINSVQFVNTEPPAKNAEAARAAEYSSNEAATTGRFLLFAVDDNYLRFGAGRTVIRNAERLLDTLAPGDQVGFARLPGGRGGVEFTTDRAAIREALSRLYGGQPARSPDRVSVPEAVAFDRGDQTTWRQVLQRECGYNPPPLCTREVEADAKTVLAGASFRTSQTLHALEQLVDRLAALGSPTNLILFSEGLYVSRDRHDLTEVARRAARSRVTFHIVQADETNYGRDKPEVLMGRDTASVAGEGLAELAGYTRGAMYRTSTAGIGVLDRIARELSGYYLLAFEPTEDDRTSKDRRIRVRVHRPGVEVRARSSYAIDGAVKTAAPIRIEERIRQLLLAHTPARGVPIRVASFAVPQPNDPRLRVIVSAEIGEPASGPSMWAVGLVIVDNDDKVVMDTAHIPIALAPAHAGGDARALLVNTFQLPPGDYTLRVAALAQDGREGSVQHRLVARLTPLGDRAISASHLIIGSEPAKPGMPLQPTPSAVIDTEMMSVVVELTSKDGTRLRTAGVSIQVARTEEGSSIVTSTPESIPVSTTQRAFLTAVNLSALEAGEYIARAIITMPGERESVIARRFVYAPRQ